jgi:hypothetical protein
MMEIMKFVCRISQKDGTWTAEHTGQDLGPIRLSASTRGETLRKMEEEIRYWLEMCPCSGESYRDLQHELVGFMVEQFESEARSATKGLSKSAISSGPGT